MTMKLSIFAVFIALVCATPATGQLTCENWGNWDNLHPLTAQKVASCLEKGVDVNARDAYGYTLLHRTVSKADTAIVKVLLDAGANMSSRNSYGETALHIASEYGTPAVVRLLLASGSDEAAQDDGSATPLHGAVRNSSTAVMDLLMVAGADPEARDREGRTPMHAAASYSLHGDSAVATLLAAGADVNARDNRGNSPLHQHALYRSTDFAVLDALLAAGADVNARNRNGQTPLHIAQDTTQVAELVAAGADVNARESGGQTPLHNARSSPIVVALLAAGADVGALDNDGKTPLHAVARNGDAASIAILVDAGSEVHARAMDGRTALHEAALGRNVHVIDSLAAVGADVHARDDQGNTPLHATWVDYSWLEPNPAVVGKLLEIGADPLAQNNDGELADPTHCENWTTARFRAVAGTERLATCLTEGYDINAHDEEWGRTLLHTAASDADSIVVAFLVEAGANVSARDFWGGSPLLFGNASQSPAIRPLLLAAGADINERSHDGTTVLHNNLDFETMAALVAAGADVNARDWKGATPLFAVWDADIIAMLLAAGADANMTDHWGRTPLHLYSSISSQALEHLLSAGADVNASDLRGRTPLHEAAEYEDAAVITALVAAGADVNTRDHLGNTPLHIAWHNNSSVVETLVELGADPMAKNARGKFAEPRLCENWNTRLFRETVDLDGISQCLASGWDLNTPNAEGELPVERALESGRRAENSGALALLLRAGADPNTRDSRKMTPLHRAANMGDITAATLLLEAGADPNMTDEVGATPLHRTISNVQYDCARILLDAGAELDAKDRDGNTPLHWAIRSARSGLIVNLLLDAGADVTVRNELDQTPLHFAMQSSAENYISSLLNRGADPNARDLSGWTPLHFAAQSYYRPTDQMLTALIKAGADVNSREESGETALHILARQDFDPAMMNALVESGADVDAADSLGNTPLHLASAAPNPTNARALLAAGADVNTRTVHGDTPLHRVGSNKSSHRRYWTSISGIDALPHLAMREGSEVVEVFDRDTSMVGILVRAGADMEARNDRGETALQGALRRGDAHQAQKLLQMGASPDPEADAITPPKYPVCDWMNYDLFTLAPIDRIKQCPVIVVGIDTLSIVRSALMHTLFEDSQWNHFLLQTVSILLNSGADPSARDSWGQTPLHGAARGRGSNGVGRSIALPEVVAAFLAAGADVNARDHSGTAPLHAAAGAFFDNTEAAKLLLDAGADIEARNRTGSTPLHLSSGVGGRLAMAQLLVRNGSDLAARNSDGETPLHVAARGQYPAMAALLQELGADPTHVDSSGTTANPVSCDKWPTPVFFFNATADNVARCIEAGSDVGIKVQYDRVRNLSGRIESYAAGSTPLHVAAGWTQDPAVVELLINLGEDINARNRASFSPLHYAARDNTEPAVIAALASAGADVNAWATGSMRRHVVTKWDVTPLHMAAHNDHPGITLALVDAGADINAVAAGGRTPLHHAAAESTNPAVIEALSNRGADVNARLPGGRTPLHEAAAKNRNPGIVTALLEAGAEINALGANDEVWSDRESMVAAEMIQGRTPWGGAVTLTKYTGKRTPLHEAVMERGDSAVVAALIAGRADVNARADLDHIYGPGATPLYWSIYANPDPAVLELLVRAGADVNARAESGWTPLHLAALRNPVLFPILLELGADPDATDRYGKTPVDYAVKNPWLEGWDVLETHRR